jgi:hypothetical protein
MITEILTQNNSIMDQLPKDVLSQISLLLQPGYLMTINKRFQGLYDEYYYKSYLSQIYPNVDFENKGNYKQLTINSMKQFDIRNKLLGTQNLTPSIELMATKTTESCSVYGGKLMYLLTLNFLGELRLVFYKNNSYLKKIILVDTNVTDMDDHGYIKQNKLYYIDPSYYIPSDNKQLLFTGKTSFNQIMTEHVWFYVLCHNKKGSTIYHIYHNGGIKKEYYYKNKIVMLYKNRDYQPTIQFENGSYVLVHLSKPYSEQRNL